MSKKINVTSYTQTKEQTQTKAQTQIKEQTQTKAQTKEQYLEQNKKTKDEYVKAEITYTDKLSKSQINQLLYDYEKVENVNDIQKINLGTFIRYFENKNGELKFRTGGILTVNTGYPDYLILSNGKISWSVQIKNCIFFKRITIEQIREEYNKELLRLQAENSGLRALLKEKTKKK